jgi:bifunctional enzyme CysN/CysC
MKAFHLPAPVPPRATPPESALRFGQEPVTILLTGLPGSGKTTIARALDRKLFGMRLAVAVLDDGDPAAWQESPSGARRRDALLRRGMIAARLLNDAGVICICALPAPTHASRCAARAAIAPNRLLEFHLSAPPAVCRTRVESLGADTLGESREWASYEAPTTPNLTLPTHVWHASSSVDAIVKYLQKQRVLR